MTGIRWLIDRSAPWRVGLPSVADVLQSMMGGRRWSNGDNIVP
jgi:hypothetical protein